ncbi:hypothetical protein LUZ60_007338 [Juncus effusus]|nr:hypothetical protein LUZ60_007338 [Juncus effusus]
MDKNATSSCDGQVSQKDGKNEIRNIYIWDMDETLILLKSLLDGTFAASFHGSKDIKKGTEIGKKWENMILRVCDECFYYEEIENFNEPNLDSLKDYDDGKDLSKYDFGSDAFVSPTDIPNKRKLAYRHRSISEKYKKGLSNLLDQQLVKLWNDLYTVTDDFTDAWLSSARELVHQASGVISTGENNSTGEETKSNENNNNNKNKNKNVSLIVTSGSLIPSLAKCLLYKLDDVISHDNIYSSWEVGKLQCFRWIRDRFDGPNTRFCVIGDGPEECNAAINMNWPFVKIDFKPGNANRFPGLSLDGLQSYISVMYDVEEEEEEGGGGLEGEREDEEEEY